MKFWNPMPEGAYRDLILTLWVIAIAFALWALAVAGIDALHLGFAPFDPTATYTFPA